MLHQLKELRIPDLTEEQIAELSALLDGDISVSTSELADKDAREFATATAVVMVSLAALRVLALWICRHTHREETEVSVQTQRPDGTLQTITFRSKSASAQTEEAVLKKLADACRVDASAEARQIEGDN